MKNVSEIASEPKINATAIARRHHDPLDRRPDRLHRLIAQVRSVQRALKLSHAPAIGFGQVGMDEDWGGLLGIREPSSSLGHNDAAALLNATLAEETRTDVLLTQLLGPANAAAVAQAKAA